MSAPGRVAAAIDVRSVPLEQILVVGNPRTIFEEEALQELAESIDQHGLMHPVVVRELTDDDRHRHAADAQLSEEEARTLPYRFELIAGERRLRAVRALEWSEVPAQLMDVDAAAAAELRLVENIQREDLHPLEEADAFDRLMYAHEWTAADIAAKTGRTERFVLDRLRLRALIGPARDALLANRIRIGHALLISRLERGVQKEALKAATEDWQGNELQEPTTIADLRRRIERLMKRLDEAPFDPEDPDLVPKAGACSACPYRTGAAPSLFPEVEEDDMCTVERCFASKVEATLLALIERGRTPLASWGGDEALVERLDAVPHDDWRELHRGDKGCDDTVKGVIVNGWQAAKKVRACISKSCGVHRFSAHTSPERRARERERKERKRRLGHVRQTAMPLVIDAVVESPAHQVLFELVVKTIRDSGRKALFRHLGLDRDDSQPIWAQLRDHAASIDDTEALKAAVAGLLADRLDYDEGMFDEVAGRSGADLAAFYEEARAQRKKPAVLPEDVLGTPFPTRLRIGQRPDGWDDRPWHLLKPGTKATTICGQRAKGDVERGRGFPDHRECGNCRRAIDAMIEEAESS